MRSTIQAYLSGLKGKRVAVIGIGISNTPLIRLLLGAGISVTACDKRSREAFSGLAEELVKEYNARQANRYMTAVVSSSEAQAMMRAKAKETME